jgi:hypothetical protein
MGTPIPIRVPPSWFLTTSTVFSSSTVRPYCRSLPILGFTSFPSVAKQNFPWCSCCPSKLSLRRQLRLPRRIPVSVGPRHRSDRRRPSRSPRTLPSHPFSSVVLRDGKTVASYLRKPRPQGFAPSSGPLRARPFPVARARCSLGLVRLVCSARPLCEPAPHATANCRVRRRTARRDRAGGPIGVTSKTAPKSGFSA